MADLTAIITTLIQGNEGKLTAEVQNALDAGLAAEDILNKALLVGMDTVGEKMESGDMYIPEVLMSARAMAAALLIITPLLSEGSANAKGKIVFGTVKGDLHDIGKNLVIMMLESSGFNVIDAGVDVSPEKFVSLIREEQPQILGLSALLTTTTGMMKRTVDALTEAGIRNSVKVIVGGAPVTQSFADEIGADGYAPDAGSASRLAKALLA
jgi:5-methyltetrahydrofolate--homocysteine methyltransferase